jgi:serine/threonine protein kinase
MLFFFFFTTIEYCEGSSVTTLGDVYSLGILLLEMCTGRSPTDDMFTGSLDLHKYSEDALPEKNLGDSRYNNVAAHRHLRQPYKKQNRELSGPCHFPWDILFKKTI